MITDDMFDEFVDYVSRLLGNNWSIAGIILAGPGYWVVATIGWTIPEVLFPLLGVMAVVVAGYQIRTDSEGAVDSRAGMPPEFPEHLLNVASSIEVLFQSDEGALNSLEVDCRHPDAIDVDWILREDRKALTAILNNWNFAWSSLPLTKDERKEYVRSRQEFNSNLYQYLDRLSSDLQEQQRQASLVSQLKAIQLVVENRGRDILEQLEIELRPGEGMAFATEDQIAEASMSSARVRASEILSLRKVPGFNDFLSDALLPSSDIPATMAPPALKRVPETRQGTILIEVSRLVPDSSVRLPKFTVWLGSNRKNEDLTLDVLIRSRNLAEPASRRLTITAKREYYARSERAQLTGARY